MQQMTYEEKMKTEQEVDMVNKPPHYRGHRSGVECVEIAEHMSFCLGNAFKYLYRCGNKWDDAEDIKKAIWYLDREKDLRTRKYGSTFAGLIIKSLSWFTWRDAKLTNSMENVCLWEDRFDPNMNITLTYIFAADLNRKSIKEINKALGFSRLILELLPTTTC